MVEVIELNFNDTDEILAALEEQFADCGGGFNNDDFGGGDDDGSHGRLPDKPEDGETGGAWAVGFIGGAVVGASAAVGAYRLERPLRQTHQIMSIPPSTTVTEAGMLNSEACLGVDISLAFVFAAVGAAIATKIQERRKG